MKESNLRRTLILATTALVAMSVCGTAQETEHYQVSPLDPADASHLGSSTAVNGEWAAVGDPLATTSVGVGTGACAIYRGSEQGWIHWQTLTPRIGLALQEYGFTVALHADELVIGARAGGIDKAGRVFVYRLINDQWEEAQQLRAFDGGFHFAFGSSVALDDQTLVVGSPGFPDSTYVAGGKGAAYVYGRTSGGWVLTDRITLPNPSTTPHDRWSALGKSCAVEGDIIVLGAPAAGLHGMAFVYRRVVSGWIRDSDLYLPQYNANVALEVGSKVDISNGVIAIGAPGAAGSLNWGPSQVAFFEYQTSSQSWDLQQAVRASDWNLAPGGVDFFGEALSLKDDQLVVGAYLGSYDAVHSGTAYRFERTNGIWAEVERLVPHDPNPAGGTPAFFGSSVALDGENGRIVVGSVNAISPSSTNFPGKAYFYDINQGTVVCAATPNYTLKPSRLTLTGSKRVQDANLSLSVYDAPRGFTGLYLVGPGGPPVPFGANASLCVGQPYSQLTGIKTIGPKGSAMYKIDFTAPPASALISPGVTFTFQFIHRDRVPGIGFPTINASDAVEVVFE